MQRFVRNKEILEAIEKATHRGRAPSSLDSVARILDVDNDDRLRRQVHNLAYRSQDLGAQWFLEGKRRRKI